MFGTLFKQNNALRSQQRILAKTSYGYALTQTRRNFFYEELGVPDSFDGRFDLLLVHIFILLFKHFDTPEYEIFSQDLFDETFKDMDQTLREMGIGDVGVPKHMKRMMKAFNGRIHAYTLAIAPERLAGIDIGDLSVQPLEVVLLKNVYGTLSDNQKPSQSQISALASYILKNIKYQGGAFIGLEEGKS